MSLTRYDPFKNMLDIHKEFDNFLKNRGMVFSDEDSNIATSNWTPSVDIKEEDAEYVIRADIPGVDPKDIEVSADNHTLTIKGERETKKEDEKEGYKRIERVSGSFYRRFSLPDNANVDEIAASSKDGVLELKIPKSSKQESRKIEVKS